MNIEVQVQRYKFFNQTISVVIVNHILCPDEATYLNSYDLRNPITGRLFTDLLKVLILELPKVPETDDGQQ